MRRLPTFRLGMPLFRYIHNVGISKMQSFVFNKMVYKHDVVSWNSMIHGFATNGMILEAFSLLHEMQLTWSVHPDLVALISIVPLCHEFNLLREGRSVHGFIVRRKMRLDLSLKNSIMDMYLKCNILKPAELMFTIMYSKCGRLELAIHLFKDSAEKSVASWNSMISAYGFHGQEPRSIHCVLLARKIRSLIDRYEAAITLKNSCLSLKDVALGDILQIFNIVVTLKKWNVVHANDWQPITITVGYGGGVLDFRQKLVKEVKGIGLCFQHGQRLGDLQCGQTVHGLAIRLGYEETANISIGNALISLYSQCGDIEDAELVFNKMVYKHDVVSWNSMIHGFATNGMILEAFSLLHEMQLTWSVHPDLVTLISIVPLCTEFNLLREGRSVHGFIVRRKMRLDLSLKNSIMDMYLKCNILKPAELMFTIMYSKCGRLELAIHLFKDSAEKSVASWNSMISAYGFHGQGKEAIKLFSEMCESGTSPTKSTFISLLSACSHSGLVEEGRLYYELMSTEFGVEPTIEHHVYYADMLGRSGKLSEAYEFIKDIQPQQQAGVWGALLSACKYHGDIKMGKQVAEHLFNIDPENAGYYVSLFNIYTADGRWSDAMDIRKNFQDRMLRKPPGYSLIDICSG
ncbi:hypothetical protein IFM89_036300 [Coptis chinensis]|uniref:Pentatricopeptide repeat-containing protein n=1 Tax=Coptis chinensis TaxID=261450 RepID=A0A835M876_9MAGN|nr:hypothetical protein IFM89_036300 [Coptis chinensis]